jgi:hypothetical protein
VLGDATAEGQPRQHDCLLHPSHVLQQLAELTDAGVDVHVVEVGEVRGAAVAEKVKQ